MILQSDSMALRTIRPMLIKCRSSLERFNKVNWPLDFRVHLITSRPEWHAITKIFEEYFCLTRSANNAKRVLWSAQRMRVLSWNLCVVRLIAYVSFPVLSDFSHACHQHRIFNMLNNFSHEWTFLHVCALEKLPPFIVDRQKENN
jgi:hypothetical protein